MCYTVGHLFIVHRNWRYTYYVIIACYGAALLLAVFFYFPPSFQDMHTQRYTKTKLIKQLDYLGIFIWAAGTTLFILGLSWGGSYFPWKSAGCLAPLIIGFIALILFFVWGE